MHNKEVVLTSSIVFRNALPLPGCHAALGRSTFLAALRGHTENGAERTSSSSGGQSGRQKLALLSRCALVKGLPFASAATPRVGARLAFAGTMKAGMLVAERGVELGAGSAWQVTRREAIAACGPQCHLSGKPLSQQVRTLMGQGSFLESNSFAHCESVSCHNTCAIQSANQKVTRQATQGLADKCLSTRGGEMQAVAASSSNSKHIPRFSDIPPSPQEPAKATRSAACLG